MNKKKNFDFLSAGEGTLWHYDKEKSKDVFGVTGTLADGDAHVVYGFLVYGVKETSVSRAPYIMVPHGNTIVKLGGIRGTSDGIRYYKVMVVNQTGEIKIGWMKDEDVIQLSSFEGETSS